MRDTANSPYEDGSIDRFCEDLLIRHGRSNEAYRRYGLVAAGGTTNLATFRALTKRYPDRDRRQTLIDLIKTRGDKGKWFAAAKDAGFLDIALECAELSGVDPSTLVRAARDFCDKEPRFAAVVGLLAIRHLLAGGGYDPQVSEAADAATHLLAAARQIGAVDWARAELGKLADGPCSSERQLFRHAVEVALARDIAGNLKA